MRSLSFVVLVVLLRCRATLQTGDHPQKHLGFRVEQPPGLPLRIVLFEVSEELRVSEMVQSRGIVRHPVAASRDVVDSRVVSVSPLVHFEASP